MPRKAENLVGRKFGKLLVQEYSRSFKIGKSSFLGWSCLCDCGTIREVTGADLRSGNTTSCGFCSSDGLADRNLKGKRFGHLVAQTRSSEIVPRWGESRSWNCLCDCGIEVVRRASSLLPNSSCGSRCSCNLPKPKGRLTPLCFLRKDPKDRKIYLWSCTCGNTIECHRGRLSCGCLEAERLPKTFKDANRRVWKQYKKDASRRDKEWNLTEDEFYVLAISPCHYTGATPKKLIKTQQGDFYWNGVDRKDNSKGYIPGNVLPCSDFANWAKGTRSYDEFIIWLKQVAEFWKDKKL